MSQSVKEYVGVNSLNEKADGTKITHQETYAKIVNDIGLETCIRIVPATLEEVQKSLTENEHLNNIPLQKWDNAAPYIKHHIRHLGITIVSLSDCICTLKQAAKMWAEAN